MTTCFTLQSKYPRTSMQRYFVQSFSVTWSIYSTSFLWSQFSFLHNRDYPDWTHKEPPIKYHPQIKQKTWFVASFTFDTIVLFLYTYLVDKTWNVNLFCDHWMYQWIFIYFVLTHEARSLDELLHWIWRHFRANGARFEYHEFHLRQNGSSEKIRRKDSRG